MERLSMTHHGTLTADYRKAVLAVHMDSACVCRSTLCVYVPVLAQDPFFCRTTTMCVFACVTLLVSYSFSLAHNNNCVYTRVHRHFSHPQLQSCVHSKMCICVHPINSSPSLLTKWNPILAVSPPQHPFTLPVLPTQY